MKTVQESRPRALSRHADRGPRIPGSVHACVALALVVLVGTLALSSRQSAPPTIAEFAPQAVQQIAEAGQGGADALRRAGAGPDSPDAAAEPGGGPREAIDVARVRQCVGDPPRQIDDPQSPPCVPYWSGDNGGPTWHGVTRDEIRVSDATTSWFSPLLQSFFNRRFEFYGRSLRLIPRPLIRRDPAAARGAARAAYEQDQAFASLAGNVANWSPHHYFDELARLGIIGISAGPVYSESFLATRRPHLWQYVMASDRIFATAGSWYCARFAGGDAVHAGDPLLRATVRKPGIILDRADFREHVPADPMNESLAACDEHADVAVIQYAYGSADGYDAVSAENAVLQMKTSGVTTVTCLCLTDNVELSMRAATNQAYFPEWLVTSHIYNDQNIHVKVHRWPPEQSGNLMGLTMNPMQRPYADHPSRWATQEGGGPPATGIDQWHVDDAYHALLLLASGIQMAGPRLTPFTFERGLHRTRFPNPAHRIMAGAVGFSDADHTMTDDAAEIWWSSTAQSPYPDDGPGSFCYVDHGARRRRGTFPTGDPFFTTPCDSGAS